jgi:hypothetical protein
MQLLHSCWRQTLLIEWPHGETAPGCGRGIRRAIRAHSPPVWPLGIRITLTALPITKTCVGQDPPAAMQRLLELEAELANFERQTSTTRAANSRGLKQIAAMDIDREELLMKLGADTIWARATSSARTPVPG